MDASTRGIWWRFNHYEIDEDGGLVPASGATLESFDPWASFWPWREDWRDQTPPYIELLDLLFDEGTTKKSSNLAIIKAMKGEGSALHKLSEQGQFSAILQWCMKYGVLGIIPHTVRTLCYTSEEDIPRKLIYQRGGNGWESFLVLNNSVQPVCLSELADLNQLLGTDDWSFTQSEKTAFKFNLVGHDLVWRIENYDFIDNYLNNAACPVLTQRILPPPLSHGFWQVYSEPFVDFICMASELYQTLALLLAEDSTLEQQQSAAHWINLYAEPVTRKIVIQPDGERTVEINAPSLLSHFSSMIMIDLASPNRLYLCKSCKRIFASGTSRATFCSSTCRNRFNRREYLARQKEAKATLGD